MLCLFHAKKLDETRGEEKRPRLIPAAVMNEPPVTSVAALFDEGLTDKGLANSAGLSATLPPDERYHAVSRLLAQLGERSARDAQALWREIKGSVDVRCEIIRVFYTSSG